MITRRRSILLGLSAGLAAFPFSTHAGGSLRVVSIGGSTTETIYFLGRENVLIGSDTTSIFPQAAENLPKVGYMRQLSVEGILSLNPTMVLAEEGSGPPTAMASLKSVGLPIHIIPEARTIQQVVDKTRLIARHVEASSRGEELIAKIEKRAEAVRQGIGEIRDRKRVLFLLNVRDNSLMAAGRDTAAEAIIELAGGELALGGFTGYKPVSAESVHKADPDVILVMDHSHGQLGGDDGIAAMPQFADLRAVRDKAIVAMNGLLLLGFGPRTPDATLQLARHFYGDAIALADLPPLSV